VEENEAEFSIYPNPVNNTLYINGGNAEYSYVMYNGMGQQVASGTAQGAQQISVSGMAKGIYFIRLTAGSKTSVEKVVVE
ncbi:MAG: T9SS type A sorting domain-containing protein, partial [bacterium]|nr:T9SS type A sorting domain-containing protein [Candidatus Limimorpha equi]